MKESVNMINFLPDKETMELMGFECLENMAVFRFVRHGVFVKKNFVNDYDVVDRDVYAEKIEIKNGQRIIRDKYLWERFKERGCGNLVFFLWRSDTNTYISQD